MSLAPGSPDGRPDAAGRSRIGETFDPSLAEHPLRTLRVDEVIDLLHVSHWPERVNDYHHAMRAGDRFPPVAVVYLGGRPFLADGHKRFHAYRRLRPTEIVVQVWPVRRWMADQYGQLTRSVERWRMATRTLRNPDHQRPGILALASQSARHWRRILRSLRTRQRETVGGGKSGETRRLGR